ncbi:MAG: LysR family transcriptional regulator [Clostridia bacterium]|nr:LysR family transcriptional regulator [Clostridia bacterium]
MTLQQLKYIVEVADRGSITEAAKALFIAQPSLSAAIQELEREIGTVIFLRSSRGVRLTSEGAEFLGYARQVVQQAGLIEEKYIARTQPKKRFAVSTQHYSFTAGAFVELVRSQRGEAYEFILREGKTADVIGDVRNLRSEMGILYLSGFNSPVIEKQLREASLQFSDLFTARPHIFIGRNNPLAGRKMVTLEDLRDLPCLTYDQGDQNALYYSEEILSSMDHDKSIMVTDKSTIVDLMVGTAGYTISSGLCPSYLRGNEIVSIPLDVDETIRVGVITHRDVALSQLARDYLAILYRLVRDSLTEENDKGAE